MDSVVPLETVLEKARRREDDWRVGNPWPLVPGAPGA
jgi:hypothetical protein